MWKFKVVELATDIVKAELELDEDFEGMDLLGLCNDTLDEDVEDLLEDGLYRDPFGSCCASIG